MDQVPTSEEDSTKFIHNFYQEKDKIYDVFATKGSYESLGKKKIELPLNYYDLFISTCWAILLCTPMFYGFFIFVKSASLLTNIIFFAILFLSKE